MCTGASVASGRNQAEQAILALLPERAIDLARLRALAEQGEHPVVTVVGKYNHGKSRLLNEMMGRATFSVADKRETVALAQQLHDGVCWLDAPGLDADVGGVDDVHAHEALWARSDVRLFVHAAKEGELDAAECDLLGQLKADAARTQRQTLLVLSQIDQLGDEAQLASVCQAIAGQTASWEQHPVSSTRYRQGVDGDKKLLLEKSGIPALKAVLQQALACVPRAREHEKTSLWGEIRTDLDERLAASHSALIQLQQQQGAARAAFDADLTSILLKVQEGLHDLVVNFEGPDPALDPDSFENAFKITPGKLERNRLQVAYSRACIAVDAVLTQHGVVGVPVKQRVASVSLNTVIVAVLGVSVKYRADLRRLFCESAGHAFLKQGFSEYFDRSDEQMALMHDIALARGAVIQAEDALASVTALESA
jgi:hypothetical protein